MGLIRLILIGVVIWLCLRMVRKYQAGKSARPNTRKPLERANMVPCHVCGVHVPESDATQHQQLWFCGTAHRDKYLADRQ